MPRASVEHSDERGRQHRCSAPCGLNRDSGLSTGRLLSDVAVFEFPAQKRLMFMTDPAVNINPDVGRKVEIIQNAVWVVHRLGIANPKVAMLAATEKINVKDMPANDAAIISKNVRIGPASKARKRPAPTDWTSPFPGSPRSARTFPAAWPGKPTF